MRALKNIMSATAMFLLGATAWGAMPQGDVFASFVTQKGLRAKEGERWAQVYVKSSVTTDTVYMQFGESADIDTLPLPKANTLYNIKKSNLSGGDILVRIWAAQTVWFLNINNNDATSFTPGTCGTSVREFRCENDSLRNMDFLPQMTALEYLVCSNNRSVKAVTLTTPALQRIQLNKMPALEKITMAGPEIYEFKVDQPLVTKIDFSGCPKIKTLLVSNAPNLTDVVLGEGAALESATFGGCTALKTLAFRDMPKLKTLAIYDNSSLSEVKLANLPALSNLNLRENALPALTLSGFPALTTVNISGNNYSELLLDNPSITSVTLDKCVLDSVDLTKLTKLRSCYIRNGNVSALGLSDDAMQNTLTTMVLTDSRFGISQLPARPKKMNATLNYYAPQAQPVIPASIKAGKTLDLSRWAVGHTLADDNVASEYKWETIFEEVLQEGTDYTVADGKFTFKHEIEDSVRCFITNTAFPAFARTVDSKGNVTDYRIITNYMVVSKGGGVSDITDSEQPALTVMDGRIVAADERAIAVFTAEGKRIANRNLRPGIYLALPAGGRAVKVQVQ